jgi:hypothetical protein
MKKLLFVSALLLAVVAMAAPAQAVPIQGSIAFGGGAPVPAPGPNWYDATGVTFNAMAVLTGPLGDYSTVPVGTLVSFSSPLSWGAGSGVVNLPVAPWGGWTFTLGTNTYSMTGGAVTNISRGNSLNNSISVNGWGNLSITGLDTTVGNWNLTAGNNGSANLSFSAAVPEPGSMLLLGTGLFGLAGAVRRRMKK